MTRIALAVLCLIACAAAAEDSPQVDSPQQAEDPARASAQGSAPAEPPKRPILTQAERAGPSADHHLDFGGSFGFNNSGGLGLGNLGYGFVLEYRPVSFAGLNIGVGSGLWGLRGAAGLKVYPLTARRGAFLHAAALVNLGGVVDLPEQNNQIHREPAAVLNATAGYRFDFRDRGFIAVEAGWGFVLRRGAWTSDQPLSALQQSVMNFAHPGGLVLGISGGISVL